VLDELITLDPGVRRLRLDAAVEAHELRAEEVEPALHLVARLDRLREMTVPPGGHLPGREILPASPEKSDQIPAAPDSPAKPSTPKSGHGSRPVVVESLHVAVPVSSDVDTDPVATWLDAVELPLDAIEAVSRLKSGRRVRTDRPGARGAATARRRAPAAAPTGRGSSTAIETEVEAIVDDHKPSIAWLRP
jgi:hypothetical protein